MLNVDILPVHRSHHQAGLRPCKWKISLADDGTTKHLNKGYKNITMHFSTQEQAILYAKAKGWKYHIQASHDKGEIKRYAYQDNFVSTRRFSWTH